MVLLQKEKIQDKFIIIMMFNAGGNLEVFWNYDQMSFQVEDIFDILTV